MSNCLECTGKTSNPKFCSRSCAALFNNRRSDIRRRTPEGRCKTCASPISTRLTYCIDCKKTSLLVIEVESSNAGKNPYVRKQARNLYIISGRPLFCAICQYSKHVDICHIKDVRSYPVGTPYSVVNDQSNLIALCKNHHWELDNAMLLETGSSIL